MLEVHKSFGITSTVNVHWATYITEHIPSEEKAATYVEWVYKRIAPAKLKKPDNILRFLSGCKLSLYWNFLFSLQKKGKTLADHENILKKNSFSLPYFYCFTFMALL